MRPCIVRSSISSLRVSFSLQCNEQVQRRMVEIFSQHRAEDCSCKTHVNLLLNYNVSGDSTEARSQFVEAGTATGMQLMIIEVSDQPTIFETCQSRYSGEAMLMKITLLVAR